MICVEELRQALRSARLAFDLDLLMVYLCGGCLAADRMRAVAGEGQRLLLARFFSVQSRRLTLHTPLFPEKRAHSFVAVRIQSLASPSMSGGIAALWRYAPDDVLRRTTVVIWVREDKARAAVNLPCPWTGLTFDRVLPPVWEDLAMADEWWCLR